MTLSDENLIARVLAHDDRHAFSELVKRHQSPVRGWLRKLTGGDTMLADDLAQDTFLRAYQRLGQYRHEAKLSSWLYQIAYRLFLNQRAARPRQETSFEQPTTTAVARSDAKLDLQKALGVLSTGERAALLLAYGEDYTHEEIAMILDCPLGTVKTNILRGKEKLKQSMMDKVAHG